MKWTYLILVSFVMKSYVFGDGVTDRYPEEKLDFMNEVDRLFDTLYFSTFVSTPPHVLDPTKKLGTESNPLPSPEWEPHESISDDVSGEMLGDDLEMSPSFDTVPRSGSSGYHSTRVVNRATGQEGSGGSGGSGWFEESEDEDEEDNGDYEDWGSGQTIYGRPGGDPVTEGKKEQQPTESSEPETSLSPETRPDPEYLQCGTDLKAEVYSCVDQSLHVNTLLVQLMDISKLNDELDVTSKYSSFVTFLRICISERITASNCCSRVDGHNNIMETITQQLVEFACHKGGGQYIKCYSSHMSHLEQCLYSNVTNNQVANISVLIAESDDQWTVEDCNDLKVIQSCFVKYVEKFDVPNYSSSVKAMLEATNQILPCKATPELTSSSVDSVSKATVGLSHGTVVTLIVGIWAIRF